VACICVDLEAVELILGNSVKAVEEALYCFPLSTSVAHWLGLQWESRYLSGFEWFGFL